MQQIISVAPVLDDTRGMHATLNAINYDSFGTYLADLRYVLDLSVISVVYSILNVVMPCLHPS